MVTPTEKRENDFSQKVLFSILLAALSVRLLWLIAQSANIEGEGAAYARLAENLLRGNGYIGISGLNSTDLVLPPLYPILIAIMSLVVRDSELAGRLVSLIMGVCLVIPVFFIASRMYGRVSAVIAASLIAFHPILIDLSTSVYCEATYITLMIGGIYWGLRILELDYSKSGMLSGICLGFAYLTRPEAIIYPFLIVAALFITVLLRKQNLKKALACASYLIVAFTLLAGPYITYLSLQTGRLRFEGKSGVNFLLGQRMRSGMPYHEANYGIDEKLTERGSSMVDNFVAIRSMSDTSLRDAASFGLTAATKNVKEVYHSIIGRSFGSPILIVLVIVGFFRTIWNQKRIVQEAFVLLTVLCVCLALLSVQHFWERFAFPLLPFLLLWASKGITEFSEWAEGTAASLSRNFNQNGHSIRTGMRWALSIVLLIYVATNYINVFKKMGSGNDSTKEAGLWLRDYAPGSKRVMDTSSVISYYAAATWFPLPYAESSLALKYIHTKRPNFVVLTSQDIDKRPYLRQWFNEGNWHENAKLIYDEAKTDEERIKIYQWNSQSTEGLARADAK